MILKRNCIVPSMKKLIGNCIAGLRVIFNPYIWPYGGSDSLQILAEHAVVDFSEQCYWKNGRSSQVV